MSQPISRGSEDSVCGQLDELDEEEYERLLVRRLQAEAEAMKEREMKAFRARKESKAKESSRSEGPSKILPEEKGSTTLPEEKGSESTAKTSEVHAGATVYPLRERADAKKLLRSKDGRFMKRNIANPPDPSLDPPQNDSLEDPVKEDNEDEAVAENKKGREYFRKQNREQKLKLLLLQWGKPPPYTTAEKTTPDSIKRGGRSAAKRAQPVGELRFASVKDKLAFRAGCYDIATAKTDRKEYQQRRKELIGEMAKHGIHLNYPFRLYKLVDSFDLAIKDAHELFGVLYGWDKATVEALIADICENKVRDAKAGRIAYPPKVKEENVKKKTIEQFADLVSADEAESNDEDELELDNNGNGVRDENGVGAVNGLDDAGKLVLDEVDDLDDAEELDLDEVDDLDDMEELADVKDGDEDQVRDEQRQEEDGIGGQDVEDVAMTMAAARAIYQPRMRRMASAAGLKRTSASANIQVADNSFRVYLAHEIYISFPSNVSASQFFRKIDSFLSYYDNKNYPEDVFTIVWGHATNSLNKLLQRRSVSSWNRFERERRDTVYVAPFEHNTFYPSNTDGPPVSCQMLERSELKRVPAGFEEIVDASMKELADIKDGGEDQIRARSPVS